MLNWNLYLSFSLSLSLSLSLSFFHMPRLFLSISNGRFKTNKQTNKHTHKRAIIWLLGRVNSYQLVLLLLFFFFLALFYVCFLIHITQIVGPTCNKTIVTGEDYVNFISETLLLRESCGFNFSALTSVFVRGNKQPSNPTNFLNFFFPQKNQGAIGQLPLEPKT